MYILAIDTTAKTATASLCKADELGFVPVSVATLNGTLTHSESTLPMIDFCLKSANVKIGDVDVLAVSAGPGSFTGVRIGVSTIKGLAFGLKDVKCVPVSSLEALGMNLDDSQRGTVIVPCMDARRNQVYNAVFKCDGKGNIARLCEDRAIGCDELFIELREKYSSKKIVLVGDGASFAYRLFSSYEGFDSMKIAVCRADRMYQNAASVARCAYLNLSLAVDSKSLNPVYLRLSQAERERNERLEK